MNGSRHRASLRRLRRGSDRGGLVAPPALGRAVLAPPLLIVLAVGAFAPPALAHSAPAPIPALVERAPAPIPRPDTSGFSAPGLPISPDPRAGAAPCTDCRGGEGGSPGPSNTIIVAPENKTIVPRTLMREQSDFRVNEALRNVPGVTRR